MQVPTDFSITFAVLPLGSWDREHAFTDASSCFDTLICTPGGKVSLIYWAPLDRPFLDEKLHDERPLDQLIERTFTLAPAHYKRIWQGVVDLDPPVGVSQYADPVAPLCFIRSFYEGEEHIIRSIGHPPASQTLRNSIEEIIRNRSTMEVPATPSAKSPKKISSSQRSWHLDYDQPATDQRGRTVIPKEALRNRPQIL